MERLRKIWDYWLRFGLFIGNLIGHIFLTLFYFTIMVPFGLGVRFFSDPMAIKLGRNSGWQERTTGDRTMDEARRLF